MTISFVRAQLLNHFAEAVSELGVNPDLVFSACGLESDLIQDDSLIPTSDVESLLIKAGEMSGCQHFGLVCARDLQFADYGALGQLAKSSSTFGASIRDSIGHLKVNATAIIRELVVEGGSAWIALNSREKASVSTQLIQFAVALNWRFNNLLTENRWDVHAVHFNYAAPEDADYYHRFFSCPVVFNSEFNGAVFDAADLNLVLPGSDPLINRVLMQHVESLEEGQPAHFLDSLKSLIASELSSGRCTIETVAKYYPYESRALQRRLQELGTNYQEVLDEVRFDKARALLSTMDSSVERVAQASGFSSSAAFSRAFRKRFDQSPKQWQKMNRR